MAEQVEFGTKPDADRWRENHPEWICDDDDARLKTVTFNSDIPDRELERARNEAIEGLAEREEGAGQVSLSDHEKEQIDFSRGNAGIPHARSVKGIALENGVDDWLAYYDPTLTVDEHREVMDRAGREGGGRRLDSQADPVQRAGQASRKAMAQECDHAEGHCRRGDPDACEYLEDQCGLAPETVDQIMGIESQADDPGSASQGEEAGSSQGSSQAPESTGEPPTQGEIEGKALGAMHRAWSGYQGAVSRLDEAVAILVEEWENAQQAAKAINAIRAEHGQGQIDFTRLEDIQETLADFESRAREDCHECHPWKDHPPIGEESQASSQADEPAQSQADQPGLSQDDRPRDADLIETAGLEPDVRKQQGQESRHAVEQGSLEADTRADPGRGAGSSSPATTQDTILSEEAIADRERAEQQQTL